MTTPVRPILGQQQDSLNDTIFCCQPPLHTLMNETRSSDASNSATNGNKREHKKLVQYIEELFLAKWQNEPAVQGVAAADLHQAARQLMKASSLLQWQDVYLWLNEQLAGLQVWIFMQRAQYTGVSSFG